MRPSVRSCLGESHGAVLLPLHVPYILCDPLLACLGPFNFTMPVSAGMRHCLLILPQTDARQTGSRTAVLRQTPSQTDALRQTPSLTGVTASQTDVRGSLTASLPQSQWQKVSSHTVLHHVMSCRFVSFTREYVTCVQYVVCTIFIHPESVWSGVDSFVLQPHSQYATY